MKYVVECSGSVAGALQAFCENNDIACRPAGDELSAQGIVDLKLLRTIMYNGRKYNLLFLYWDDNDHEYFLASNDEGGCCLFDCSMEYGGLIGDPPTEKWYMIRSNPDLLRTVLAEYSKKYIVV